MNRNRKILLLLVVSFIISVSGIFALVAYESLPVPKERGLNLQELRSGPMLGPYYVKLERKYLQSGNVFDKNGVLVSEIQGAYHYQPVAISQFALGAYEHYLERGDMEARTAFLRCADWLRGNLKKKGVFHYWEYTFENSFAPNGLYRVPWFSGMAQGQGASVLLRAFSETEDPGYLRAAEKAIAPLFHDFSEGGASVVRGDDYVFPQEYPSDPASNILNGAISAYFGVYDYYRVTGDPVVRRFCRVMEGTFLKSLKIYDSGFWSFYASDPLCLATPHYHAVHIAQLKVLWRITEEEELLQYARRFERYKKSWPNRIQYVLLNHLRQLKEFRPSDIRKIPAHLKEILYG